MNSGERPFREFVNALRVRELGLIDYQIESKSSRAAHGAVITRLATWFHAALLFALKEIHQLAHSSFLDTESFLTRMRNAGIYSCEPGRMSAKRYW